MKPIHLAVLCIVLTALFSGSSAQLGATCDLKGVPAMPSFNMSRTLGKWYAQEYFTKIADDAVPPPYRCMVHDIRSSPSRQTRSLSYSHTFSELYQELDHSQMYGEMSLFDAGSSTSESVWRLKDFLGRVHSDAVFILTNYDEWGLQYFCEVKDNYRFESLMILTRNRTPRRGLLKVLETISRAYGYSKQNLVRIDQDEAICNT